MGERSTIDRLAIASVFVAGIVEAAQAALSNAPAVTKAYPVLRLEGVWNYVPLAFITIATLLWLADQGLRIFRPNYALARTTVEVGIRPSAQKVPISINPGLVVLATAMVIALTGGILVFTLVNWALTTREADLAASPQMHMPPVIRGDVTLAYIQQVSRTQDPVSAETTLSKYLGTPMRVSGVVHGNLGGAEYSRILFLTPNKTIPRVYLIFSQSNSDARYYAEGDHIAA